MRRSLTAKQAGLTLLIAIFLSIIAGALELASDVRTLRDEVREQTAYSLQLVNGTAAEAAFQLNPDLAAQVIDGLFAAGNVQQVVIRDDFERVMASRELNRDSQTGWLIERLFGDILHYRASLDYDLGQGSPASHVGEIELRLAMDSLGSAFVERSRVVFLLSVIKAFAIAALVVAVFHVFITRPLLKVHTAIAATDPRRPGDWPKPALGHHHNDELGELVESLDELLNAFQRGLEQRDQLHQISTRDGLTGIANRRCFDDVYAASWEKSRIEGTPLAVIFLDVDHFKTYNDQFGHAVGDDTLRALASALAEVVTRPGDLVARYGGEEFVCMLANTDLEAAQRVAERIRQAIHALALPHPEAERVTASIGIASAMPVEGTLDREQLLALADQRLYRAKHAGRDRIVSGEPQA
ncbi:diguanylate cyclase (GGDEF) domain-containing protein [Franzmannia pantelleriensis]|uniref:diguanylate cyclase n=1 Tax=Franzmannia pantelleriensis TaxID=48727 RepID=A0A1G9RUL6_9GAMM|nr:sensor domain-containing diguanylate cyclase [Halomonas pantelleriensis]SDM26959.1 diguanylate cyclase (GGDEF) domain-containing protein [Halomonas pantelleriensis]